MKWRFVTVVALLGCTALLLRVRNSAEIIPAHQPLQSFPQTFAGWSSTVLPISKDVLDVLGPGDFLGEGALAGYPVRLETATATQPSAVLVVPKRQMIRLLHSHHAFSDRFIAHMLARNARLEADLVDQLFNPSEKRLARTLLLLARYGNNNKPQRVLPTVSQETLAEMIGTTRSRVNFFLNKFRKLGFIGYDARGLTINPSLLSIVVHD